MNLQDSISKLKRNEKVYIYESSIQEDSKWLHHQEREKSFWEYKINNTNYSPDPKKNFTPFMRHWRIDTSFFKDKTVLEIGSGPFGFFSAISQINPEYLPKDLVIADSLMCFYQKFELSNMIPEKAIRLQTRGEDIPLPDNTFDIILTTNTIDHVQDCNIFLKEIRRLLKPEGLLLFSVHVIASAISVLKPLIKRIDTIHPYHFMKHEIIRLLQNNRFELSSIVTVPLYREDLIPKEIGLIKKYIYFIGFHVMDTLYGVARRE